MPQLKTDATNQLETIWPRDNWASLINDERPDNVLKLLIDVYDSIRENPRTEDDAGITNEQWEKAYAAGLEILKAIFRKTRSPEQATEINERFASRLGIDYHNIDHLPLDKTYPYWSISKLSLPSNVKNALTIPCIKNESETDTTDNSINNVNITPTDQITSAVIDAGNTSPVARKSEEVPIYPVPEISIEVMKSEYGLKDISIASDVEKNTNLKNMLLHQANLALSDLAETLNISKKWIGLSSTVTLNLDVNGSVTGENVHTITHSEKMNSLPIAQQWGRCFDAYIALSINKELNTADTYASTMEINSLKDLKSALVRAIATRVNEVIVDIGTGTIRKSEYYKSTLGYIKWKKIPAGELETPPALFARAFCAYIHDCIMMQKKTNPALTGDTLKLTGIPYPIDAERKRLGLLFQGIFGLLRPNNKVT